MRSQQVALVHPGDVEEQDRHTDLQVCRSGAGYYIGTMYNNPDGFQEPGSRDSKVYYPTSEVAQAELDKAIQNPEGFDWRLNP